MNPEIINSPGSEAMEDWVRLRHNCSPYEIFLKLRAGCEEDVKVRNELKEPGQQLSFRMTKNGNSFLVLREGPRNYASIEFKWNESEITVRSEMTQNFQTYAKDSLRVTLTLTDEGDCRIKMDSQELTCAQFRKRVLEDLLFNF